MFFILFNCKIIQAFLHYYSIKELNENIKQTDKLNKEEIKSINKSHIDEVGNIKEEIKAINKAHTEEIKEIDDKHKNYIETLKKELSDKFNNDIKTLIEMEKEKHQIALDKVIGMRDLIELKYENLKTQLDQPLY